jgi:HTH-type transcriptional regulator / antitoxin HigA
MSKPAKTAYIPDSVSPPGETLQETLEMLGMTQAELAERTGRPKKTINEIVQGKAAITPETAFQFELVLKVPANFWLARETKYRTWLASLSESERLERESCLLNDLPVKEMVSYGWLEPGKDKKETTKAALSYFGVVSTDKIPLVEEAAFRRSEKYATSPWSLAAWLRQGELKASEVSVGEYDSAKFMAALQKVRLQTLAQPAAFVPAMVESCAQAGVVVVFVKELPKTLVSGATRWLGGNRPLIQLTLRHKCNDMFWFSFFHEAAHVYLEHAKKEVFLEDKFGKSLDHLEDAANRFASEILLPGDELKAFMEKGVFTEPAIVAFARSQKIHPGIVVGRLQFENKLPFNRFRDLKESFSWESWPAG